MDWQEFWDKNPATYRRDQLFHQVAKTIGGQPIPPEQFKLVIQSIVSALSLEPQHDVLDVCCGNGLITSTIAPLCHTIAGVDYSRYLIETANQLSKGPNSSYRVGDATKIGSVLEQLTFDRAYMYEGLQHFAIPDLAKFLRSVRPHLKPQARIFIAGIPDRAGLWRFYNTAARRFDFLKRTVLGTEAIGTWWKRSTVKSIGEAEGYDTEIRDQPEGLYTAHYRFNAVLTPRS